MLDVHIIPKLKYALANLGEIAAAISECAKLKVNIFLSTARLSKLKETTQSLTELLSGDSKQMAQDYAPKYMMYISVHWRYENYCTCWC